MEINGKWGYINPKGEIVIEPQFDRASDFSAKKKGLARVRIGDKWGYINRAGKFFDQVWDFSEGLAVVNIGGKNDEDGDFQGGGKYGYINRAGDVVINPQFDDAWDFSEGLARVKISDKYGYINRAGDVVINPQFDDAWDFSKGLARVKISDKWGYINRVGEVVIEPQFDVVENFSEGLARVKISDKWGYINRAGDVVINPQFDVAENFSEGVAVTFIHRFIPGGHATTRTEFSLEGLGLAPVIVEVEKEGRFIDRKFINGIYHYWGFINREGKYFDNVWDFSEGLARVRIGNKWGYINRAGEVVIEPQFYRASDFSK